MDQSTFNHGKSGDTNPKGRSRSPLLELYTRSRRNEREVKIGHRTAAACGGRLRLCYTLDEGKESERETTNCPPKRVRSNPVRLEQRMGRIHRYGQEHNCLIFNFAALNTREGRVLQKLLERLSEIRKELGTDRVFDVVGEVFPSNLLEKLFREMYARRTDLPNIEARIVRDVDADRFRKITNSTLEGLAKRELNLAAIVGKSAEARERRLIPEVIEDFFTTAGPIAGVNPRPVQK